MFQLVSIRGHDSFSNLTNLCLGRGTSWCRYLISAADYDYGESWHSDYGDIIRRVNVFEGIFQGCDFGPIWWCEFGPIRGGRIWCEMGPIYTLISWPIFGLPISRFVWDLPKRSPRMRQNSPPRAPKMTPKNTPFFPIFPQFSPKNRGLWQRYLGFRTFSPISWA
jgi:hypothetical protein